MSEKVVSFSIAAYNIEKYIDQCLGSILKADMNKEIEILIVDDGSSDATADMAKSYEDKYPGTVRLISKENGGHGSTINTGIAEAKGRYFKAIDGDDWLRTDNVAEYVRRLKEEDADIVLCNYENHFDGGVVTNTVYKGLEDNKSYTFEEIISCIDWMNYHSVTFKTDLLKKSRVHLDEHCFYVDTELMIFPIPLAETVRYYDMSLYCYRRDNEGQSVSENSRMKNINDSKKVAIRLLRFFKRYENNIEPSKRKYIMGGLAGHCIWHFRGLTFFAPDRDKRNDLIRFERYVKKISPDIFNLMTVPAVNRPESDIKIIKAIRKTNYKLFNTYGVYRKAKRSLKENVKKIISKKK